MTDNMFNKLNMSDATMYMLHTPENSPIWSGNLKVSAKVTAILTNVAEIRTTAGIQDESGVGLTENKDFLWSVAVKSTDKVVVSLKPYFKDINDTNSYKKVNHPPSYFQLTKEEKAVSRMQSIHDIAAGIDIAELADFNLVSGDITGLQTAITNFTNAIPQNRALKATTSHATGKLTHLFSKLSAQYKDLDDFMGIYKFSQGDFYRTYKNARKIIDLGKSHKTAHIDLMPMQFTAVLGQKFEAGDTFVIRNYSPVAVHAFITDTPEVLPALEIGIVINANSEIKLSVPEDFGGIFAHWLLFYNHNQLDDAEISVLLAHGESSSSAPSPENFG